MPIMMSEIAAALSWGLMLDARYGPVNDLLLALNLIRGRIIWLADHPLLSIIWADAWQWSPFIMLISLAGLHALPTEPLEAAMMDGASSYQRFRYITLPLVSPILLVGIILRSMDAIKMYGKVYMLTKGGPGSASEVISFYIYLQAFRFWDLPYASALSFILLIVVGLLINLFFRVVSLEE